MTQRPTLTGQTINLAARATQAVLERLLDETGTSFHEWVTLNATAVAGGSISEREVERRLRDSLKRDADGVAGAIARSIDRGHLRRVAASEPMLEVTASGSALHERIRAGSAEISARLYDGLPAADLETTARVLGTVRERANAALSAADA